MYLHNSEDDMILFGRDRICQELGISKRYFYRLTRSEESPIKKVEGEWSVVYQALAEWLVRYREDRVHPPVKGKSQCP